MEDKEVMGIKEEKSIDEGFTYLATGSIVLIKDKKNRMMIFGRRVRSDEDGKIYDYVACRYPQGSFNMKDRVYFNHDDIQMVFFIGFQDMEELVYREILSMIPEGKTASETDEYTKMKENKDE